MESKETKQSFALVIKKEVDSSTEIFEEIKLEHVGEPKPLWQHNATILHDFKDLFMQKESARDASFQCSYHLLLTHGRDESMIHH